MKSRNGKWGYLTTRTTALRALLAALESEGYDFVTPTPSVCRRAAELRLSRHAPLRAIFGWSQEFTRSDLDPGLFEMLLAAGLLAEEGVAFKSRVRVSRLAGMLFLHSAFPAKDKDAVFLG